MSTQASKGSNISALPIAPAVPRSPNNQVQVATSAVPANHIKATDEEGTPPESFYAFMPDLNFIAEAVNLAVTFADVMSRTEEVGGDYAQIQARISFAIKTTASKERRRSKKPTRILNS